MPKAQVWFEIPSEWTAVLEYDELRELSSQARRESWEGGDGWSRCPALREIEVQAHYIPECEHPMSALLKHPVEVGYFVQASPVRIIGIETAYEYDGDD